MLPAVVLPCHVRCMQGIDLQTPLQALSGGWQRRASLAVALARKPRLLLLDEPLSGLDWRACQDIAAVLRAPLPGKLVSGKPLESAILGQDVPGCCWWMRHVGAGRARLPGHRCCAASAPVWGRSQPDKFMSSLARQTQDDCR